MELSLRGGRVAHSSTTALQPCTWCSPFLLCLTMITVLLRWGNIPLDDAVQFNHLEVVKLLQNYQDSYILSETQAEAAAEALSKENLESMV